MPDYRVFGGRLRSDVPFPHLPGLRPGGTADWTLIVADGAPPPPAGEPRGEDRVTPRVRVRLVGDGDGVRLVYDDTGHFAVSGDGRRITWWPGPDADPDAARIDVLGRVLPMALQLRGLLVLHASAVRTPAGAVGFMGPKGSGKTTLAMALHREGATVITDDALAVEVAGDGVARAWPGVANLRLRRDAADHAGLEPAGEAASSDDGRTVMGLAEEAPGAPLPLAALFLLDPLPPDASGSPPARRAPLETAPTALAVVGQAKLGPLLGPSGAPELLRRAASLARAVPVERLRVPRDLGRLEEAARAVLAGFAGGGVAEARR